MASFKDQIESDLSSVFFNNEYFAYSATFTPVTGNIVTCDVIIDHNALVQLDGYEIGVSTIGTTIEALITDVGTPRGGDTFTVEGVTYIVKSIDSNDGHVIKLVVKQDS